MKASSSTRCPWNDPALLRERRRIPRVPRSSWNRAYTSRAGGGPIVLPWLVHVGDTIYDSKTARCVALRSWHPERKEGASLCVHIFRRRELEDMDVERSILHDVKTPRRREASIRASHEHRFSLDPSSSSRSDREASEARNASRTDPSSLPFPDRKRKERRR